MDHILSISNRILGFDRDNLIFRNVQREINLALYRKFAEEGMEFAYPTQTLFVER
jgi:small-conductance mechanosensitive channel